MSIYPIANLKALAAELIVPLFEQAGFQRDTLYDILEGKRPSIEVIDDLTHELPPFPHLVDALLICGSHLPWQSGPVLVAFVTALAFKHARPSKFTLEGLRPELRQLSLQQTVRVIESARFKFTAESEVFRLNASELWKRISADEYDLGELPEHVPPARLWTALAAEEQLQRLEATGEADGFCRRVRGIVRLMDQYHQPIDIDVSTVSHDVSVTEADALLAAEEARIRELPPFGNRPEPPFPELA